VQMKNFKRNRINEHYERLHDSYLKYYGNTFQAHRTGNITELLAYLNSHIHFNKGDVVLDAGCGVCGPAIYFATKNEISIRAITNSEKQCVTAAGLIEENALTARIQVQLGDYHHLEKYYKPACFDKVYFLESLGHSADKKQALFSAMGVLKEDGILFIKDYFATEISGSFRRKRIMKTAVKRMNKEYAYCLEDLKKIHTIADDLGLKILHSGPAVVELDNTDSVGAFEKANNIVLFDDESFMPEIVKSCIVILKMQGKNNPVNE